METGAGGCGFPLVADGDFLDSLFGLVFVCLPIALAEWGLYFAAEESVTLNNRSSV